MFFGGTDKKTLARCHIYRMLRGAKKHVSFHTPGHKIGKYDVTELSFSDNLSAPTGCIAQAQADIARLLGANASFLLTDGSTSGVYSMLYAAKAYGVKKIAAPVLSHKSFFHGCELLGLTPVLLENVLENGIPAPLSLEEVEGALAQADALFITSPDYYGNIPDLAALQAVCASLQKPFLIDGAHGGHLHFQPTLYAGNYADLWVDGVHKSLPALTQGAVVSAKDERFAAPLKEGVERFRTSSPSYPIMASVEYAVKYPRNEGLEERVRAFASTHDALILREDWTKLLVLSKDAFALQKMLEKQGIYAEFCDGEVVCFYLSPATTKREFQKLQKALLPYLETPENRRKIDKNRVHAPVETENSPIEWVALANAEGRICGKSCGLFPPCLPLLIKGEVITKEKLEKLRNATGVFGLENGKIAVLKGEER